MNLDRQLITTIVVAIIAADVIKTVLYGIGRYWFILYTIAKAKRRK